MNANLFAAFAATLSVSHERAFLLLPEGAWLSRGEVLQESARLANWLASLGLPRGARGVRGGAARSAAATTARERRCSRQGESGVRAAWRAVKAAAAEGLPLCLLVSKVDRLLLELPPAELSLEPGAAHALANAADSLPGPLKLSDAWVHLADDESGAATDDVGLAPTVSRESGLLCTRRNTF